MRCKPFKVICTSDVDWYFYKKVFFGLFNKKVDVNCGPQSNDKCTVIGKHMGIDGLLYFHLQEYPDDINGEGWEADCFSQIKKEKSKIKSSISNTKSK